MPGLLSASVAPVQQVPSHQWSNFNTTVCSERGRSWGQGPPLVSELESWMEEACWLASWISSKHRQASWPPRQASQVKAPAKRHLIPSLNPP